MERMTLREAAQFTARSITTLRRYIRSGRLRAEKRFGRFGPEYFLAAQDLLDAGLSVEQPNANNVPAVVNPQTTALATSAPQQQMAPGVPISLFQELQMKHEQLLVQYGMIRAAGMRSMEVQKRLNKAQESLARVQQTGGGTAHDEMLDQQLREAHLELEGRALEILALKEKVRGLEMLTRNEVTNETIDKQFNQVVDQTKRLQRLRSSDLARARPAEPHDDA
jgi:hypothetical protein